MVKPQKSAGSYINWRGAAVVLIIGLLLIAVVPQFKNFNRALDVAEDAQVPWLALGTAMVIATYCLAAGVYRSISPHKLRYGPTLVVQLATMFTNRLLPAGIGGAGLNYDYLRRQGCRRATAVGTIAINNLLGIVSHGLLLILALVVFSSQNEFEWSIKPSATVVWIAVAAIVAVAIAVSVAIRKFGQKFANAWHQLRQQLAGYRRQPGRLALGLFFSIFLTLGYTTALWSVCHAVGANLSFAAVFFVLTGTVVGSNITPTPGGIGGAEASLVAILVLYNVDTSSGLAVALLYRLLTFWLPLVAGIGTFIVARRQKYI